MSTYLPSGDTSTPLGRHLLRFLRLIALNNQGTVYAEYTEEALETEAGWAQLRSLTLVDPCDVLVTEDAHGNVTVKAAGKVLTGRHIKQAENHLLSVVALR